MEDDPYQRDCHCLHCWLLLVDDDCWFCCSVGKHGVEALAISPGVQGQIAGGAVTITKAAKKRAAKRRSQARSKPSYLPLSWFHNTKLRYGHMLMCYGMMGQWLFISSSKPHINLTYKLPKSVLSYADYFERRCCWLTKYCVLDSIWTLAQF